MPRQNRVNPFGELVATPERGAWTGNRGVLINREGRLLRPWRLKRWIICRLAFKDHWRPVWTPGRWTELFFLDEATALAAGHRPCFYCRRAEAQEFRQAWEAANGAVSSFVELDERLHASRRQRFRAAVCSLPEGTMVELSGIGACLWHGKELRPWSFGGYGDRLAGIAGGEVVTVLTPAPVVQALRAGYRCQIEPPASPDR